MAERRRTSLSGYAGFVATVATEPWVVSMTTPTSTAVSAVEEAMSPSIQSVPPSDIAMPRRRSTIPA